MQKFKSLQEVKEYAEEQLRVHLLNNKGWVFKFDRASSRFGCCKSRINTITLSKKLTLLNLDYNPDKIKNVILHEIAHALVRVEYGHFDKYGRRIKPHGIEWQQMCREVGIDPVRCYDPDTVQTVKGKYKYVCINCGREVYKHRRMKRRKSCGTSGCGEGIFDVNRLLVLEEAA